MMATPPIKGIHHITAVASSAADNLAFYENVLGLRLVKRTVNFDDPYTYHFYYADAQGSPGTILTFFPWENLPKGRPGAGMVTAVGFAVARESVAFWLERLHALGIPSAAEQRFGDPVIMFEDPHGLPLELIGVDDPPPTQWWKQGPIERLHAVRGFHSATSTLNSLTELQALLTEVMGMKQEAREGGRIRFKMDGDVPGHYYDVLLDPKAPAGRPGGGTVHHIAFRTANRDAQSAWQALLRRAGSAVTDVRDRNYFHSIYFGSPGGVLFEIATDIPGFTVDEPAQELGNSLKLPGQYEPLRADIKKRLPALREAGFRHQFVAADSDTDDGSTFVTLHGTGGSEQDLIPLAQQVCRASAILSPLGKVQEDGLARFFRRLADNVFDEADVVQRAYELAGFVKDAAYRYGRRPDRLAALGYSNGANVAAAVLLLRPDIFSSAVLLRPMRPLEHIPVPDLGGRQILILRGVRDTVIPSQSTDQLIQVLRDAGARVTVRGIQAGHEITSQDIEEIKQWREGFMRCRPDGKKDTPVEEVA